MRMTINPKRLIRWGVGGFVLLGFPFWLYSCMILMPGKSHRGPLPPLTPVQSALVPALRRDVVELAEKIGERNVVKYAELRRAADYVESQMAAAGSVSRHAYTAAGRP